VTDLATKLQLKKASRLELIGVPESYRESLAIALGDMTLEDEGAGGEPPEAVLAFVTGRDEAIAIATRAFARVAPGGLAWIAYPKGGAKTGTDINRDILWQMLLAIGWRPVRQIAVDEVWSAIRFRPEVDTSGRA
jgi:hypothetical protein